MKKHSSANILLIELVLVILFFLLCASTIVEMFGTARLKSEFARKSSQAILIVENLEARLAGTDDMDAELEKAGFVPEEGRWVLQQDGYRLFAVESGEQTETGTLRKVSFSAEQETGGTLFELPVVHYFPGEVSP